MKIAVTTVLLAASLMLGGALLAQTASPSPSPTDTMTPSGAPATGLGGGN